MQHPDTIAFLPVDFLSEIQRKEFAAVVEMKNKERAQNGTYSNGHGEDVEAGTDDHAKLIEAAIAAIGTHDPAKETEEEYIGRLNDEVYVIIEERTCVSDSMVAEPDDAGDAGVGDASDAAAVADASIAVDATATADDEIIIIDDTATTPTYDAVTTPTHDAESEAPKQYFTCDQLKETEMQLCPHGQVDWSAINKGRVKAVSRAAAEQLLKYYNVQLRDTLITPSVDSERVQNGNSILAATSTDMEDVCMLENGVSHETNKAVVSASLKTGQVILLLWHSIIKNLAPILEKTYAYLAFSRSVVRSTSKSTSKGHSRW